MVAHIAVPAEWVRQENAELLAEYWPDVAGSRGLLQISRLPRDQFDFISAQPDLGASAAEIGSRLPGFGIAGGSKQGVCSMGRFGMASFPSGSYPVILLWLTLSKTSAFMWTWIGPSIQDPEVRDAVRAVMESVID